MGNRIYKNLIQKKKNGIKSFAILIDPDHSFSPHKVKRIIKKAVKFNADLFFVGGSYFLQNHIEECIKLINQNCKIPVILFPGNISHVNFNADAILFLSLISGRNPDYLIGQHVIAAPELKNRGVEVISTGYILVDGGRPSTVSYITFSNPIPQDQPGLIAATALAGEMLGMKLIYLEAGSGAEKPVSGEIIRHVSEIVTSPLLVGGGINTVATAQKAIKAGADLIVVGNKIDESPDFISEISNVIRKANNR